MLLEKNDFLVIFFLLKQKTNPLKFKRKKVYQFDLKVYQINLVPHWFLLY